MTYTFMRLRNKSGVSLRNPKGDRGVILDIGKDRKAYVFSGPDANATVLGVLNVLEFEAHAAGLFLRGYESPNDGLKAVYQEWFLGYEIRDSEEKGRS